MKKAIILASGGLDSAVCTAYAIDKYGKDNVTTVSITYGQKHIKEIECARKMADYYGIAHMEKDITAAMDHTKAVSSLLSGSNVEIHNMCYAELIEKYGKPNTEVPMRNGIFLVIAGSIAMSVYPDEEVSLIYGAHSDDAAGNAYPDCTPEFAETADKLISIGSRGLVTVERPLIDLNKAGVVKLGLEFKVDFSNTWSCYYGGDVAEGECGTCRDRIAAFRANGVIDPIPYAKPIDWTGCKKIDYLADKYVD